MVIAALGYGTYLVASVRRERIDTAFLRALGMSKSAYLAMVAVEHLSIALFGLFIGSLTGLAMSQMTVDSIAHTETGGRLLPPFVMVTEWLPASLVYGAIAIVGIAAGTPQGLVVPVLRDTDNMKIADVEKTIVDFGKRARDGKLGIDEMQGGTFTITNGGIFGSLMSTPIINPPQTAILGMHKIQERPMAVNGKVEIRPMMYLALSYDHRMIDGKDAVQFLVTIKELLEDPARLLLDV